MKKKNKKEKKCVEQQTKTKSEETKKPHSSSFTTHYIVFEINNNNKYPIYVANDVSVCVSLCVICRCVSEYSQWTLYTHWHKYTSCNAYDMKYRKLLIFGVVLLMFIGCFRFIPSSFFSSLNLFHLVRHHLSFSNQPIQI